MFNIRVEMLSFIMFSFVGLVISVIMILASYILAAQQPNFEKLSSYECGFQKFMSVNLPFDVQFYRVAILFLIFDVEIAFLFPWAVYFQKIGVFGHISVLVFLIILIIGFWFEWKMKALT